MITVNQPRENGRTTFCRQFTYNPKGEYNSRRDGAIVSGTPVPGFPANELIAGTFVELGTGQDKYIVANVTSNQVAIIPTTPLFQGVVNGQSAGLAQYRERMSEKANEIVMDLASGLTKDQVGGGLALAGTYQYFSAPSGPKKQWGVNWFLLNVPNFLRYINTGGSIITAKTSTLAYYRPVFYIPGNALMSPTPNADGAYELL